MSQLKSFQLGTLCRGPIKPRRIALAALAGVLFLLTGCTVGPTYVRPEAAVPQNFKETAGWKVAQPKDHILRGAWWEIFNDPQLSDLERLVDLSNQDIAVAEAQFRQARALVQASRSGYFPQVAFGASASRSRVPNGGVRSTGSPVTASDFSLPADVSWELDLWGRVRRTVEASKANAQASAADLEATRLIVQAELAQDYFQLRTLDAQKQLFEATVAAYEKSLELTKNRYAKGVASKADVLQAETQLKAALAQEVDLGVQRAQLEHAIALLVGKPASVFSISFAPLTLTVVPPAVPVGVPSNLLERRPDIAAAERQTAAANARIGVAEAAFYPTVTLSASGGFQASDLAKWLSWPSRFWSVGASLSELVFEGGFRRAQTEQARAAYDANVASYRQTVLTAFQEVEDNLAALRILEEEARIQDEAVKAAEQSVNFSNNQYKAGIISYLSVVVVQTIALANERTAIDILGRRMIADVLLIKALGGGWETNDHRQLHLGGSSGTR